MRWWVIFYAPFGPRTHVGGPFRWRWSAALWAWLVPPQDFVVELVRSPADLRKHYKDH